MTRMCTWPSFGLYCARKASCNGALIPSGSVGAASCVPLAAGAAHRAVGTVVGGATARDAPAACMQVRLQSTYLPVWHTDV
jgi:hypothetical protein